MLSLQKINDEVFYSKERIITLGIEEIEFLIKKAYENKTGKARICCHIDVKDPLHEMFIAITKNAYFQPHKHLHKSESLFIVRGKADVVIFKDSGKISRTIHLDAQGREGSLYYRLSRVKFHTVLPRSEVAVIHEVTNGPFKREDTVYAAWGTDDYNLSIISSFLNITNNNQKRKNKFVED